MPISIPEDERASLGLPTAQRQGPSMAMPPGGQGSISGQGGGFWKNHGSKIIGLAGTALSSMFGGAAAGSGFAQGYGTQAIKIQDENRKRQLEAEDFNIRKAHESMAQLKTLRIPDLRGKVPDAVLENVMKLVREYNEALMETSPGKGTLTPAEAGKIVQHYGLLQGEIGSMLNTQKNMDAQTEYTNKAAGQREAEISDIGLQQVYGGKPLSQAEEGDYINNPSPEQVQARQQSPGFQGRAISEWARRNQPINVPFNGQQIPVAPEKVAPYAALGARQEHWNAQEQNSAADRAVRLYLGTLRADVAQRIAQSGRVAQLTQALTQLYNQVGEAGFRDAADRVLAMSGGPPNVGNPIQRTPPPRSPADWSVTPE